MLIEAGLEGEEGIRGYRFDPAFGRTLWGRNRAEDPTLSRKLSRGDSTPYLYAIAALAGPARGMTSTFLNPTWVHH